MATIADTSPAAGGRDEGFFLGAALVMALVIVAGFSTQLAMGRSSFNAPLYVHAHAVVFMGWVGIFVLQNAFVATGRMSFHRRLGWIAAAWTIPMLVLGCVVTVALLRRGAVPFFFKPLQFLVFDPLSLLLGPGFGRLLPMPLLVPWAWEATFAACMIFPLIGMFADWRRTGRVHQARFWGVGAFLVLIVATEAITYGPFGTPLYNAVVAGSPGAAIDPLGFPPPPGPPPNAGGS